MKIGDTIGQLRVERGWSLDELAERVGITKSSLSRMENNSQWPRPDTLEAVASALDIKIYQLFALADAVSLPVAPPRLGAGREGHRPGLPGDGTGCAQAIPRTGAHPGRQGAGRRLIPTGCDG